MSDPWSELPAPASRSALSARRVDDEIYPSFFWAVDADGHCMLMLQHEGPFPTDVKIPRLRGIHIARASLSRGGQILLRLEDTEQRDIFEQFCRDIVSACQTTESDESAIRVSLSRTWRWYHLLKGGPGRLLTEEKQKGLIGELLTLEALFLKLDLSVAVDSWRGPLGEAKDFALPGGLALESKAVRGVDSPFVQITSEWQLDRSEITRLFLLVAQVSRSAEAEPDALTLTQVVDRVRAQLVKSAPSAVETFDSKLFAAGYRPQDDYSDYWWELGELMPFEVTSEFPRIEATGLPHGAAKVTYNVLLSACASFHLDMPSLLRQLSSAHEA